jgi:hypothetical protein
MRIIAICMGAAVAAGADEAVIRQTSSLPAPEALQAAAADERFVYAIDSTSIAKYSRETGERIAISKGDAKHLNSGFLWEGKVYCAHSNYPRKPEHSEIKVLDPSTMELATFKDFGASDGSLTWVVRDGPFWWCTFAFYDADNAKTKLVKYDAEWRELGTWKYPAQVVADLGKYSISGGIWHGGDLLATGHDKRMVYRLRLPKSGDVLEFAGNIPSPFPGQGIAADPKTGGFVGIDRSKKQVIFGALGP